MNDVTTFECVVARHVGHVHQRQSQAPMAIGKGPPPKNNGKRSQRKVDKSKGKRQLKPRIRPEQKGKGQWQQQQGKGKGDGNSITCWTCGKRGRTSTPICTSEIIGEQSKTLEEHSQGQCFVNLLQRMSEATESHRRLTDDEMNVHGINQRTVITGGIGIKVNFIISDVSCPLIGSLSMNGNSCLAIVKPPPHTSHGSKISMAQLDRECSSLGIEGPAD
eukprot:988853-Amphidinium_carterae.3